MPNNEKLLTAEERDACQKIAASDAGIAGQRAAALLATDQGATRAQASEQTGLTVGQIGYLLRTFRQKRLGMFPDVGPGEAPETEKAASEPEKDKGKKKAKKGKKAKAKKKAKSKKAKVKKGKAAKKKKSKKK
jgi:hypothetical protein